MALSSQSVRVASRPCSSLSARRSAFAATPVHRPSKSAQAGRASLRVAAEAAPDADAELEARLAKFKGTRDWKDVRAERESGAKGEQGSQSTPAPSPAPAKVLDWGTETTFFEGPPARGDLAVNLLLGATLLWLPLSLAAVGRALWVNYKVTDKRVSVTSTSPFGAEQLDASFSQMKEVRAIGRGLGYWGDMVIVLNDGAKIEMRSIDRWQEIKKYIEDKIAEAEKAKEAGYAARQKR